MLILAKREIITFSFSGTLSTGATAVVVVVEVGGNVVVTFVVERWDISRPFATGWIAGLVGLAGRVGGVSGAAGVFSDEVLGAVATLEVMILTKFSGNNPRFPLCSPSNQP